MRAIAMRTIVVFAVMVSVLGVGALPVQGASPEDFTLRLEEVSREYNEAEVSIEVLVVGSWRVHGVMGWSWGLCHNGQEAKIGDCAGQEQPANPCVGGCANIECPQDMATAGLGGGAVAFHSLNIYEDGITQGVLIHFTMQHDLDANDRFEFLKIKYVITAPIACLEFCDTLGSPPVETGFIVQGVIYPPAHQQGTCLYANSLSLVDTGNGWAELLATTDRPLRGFSLGLRHDEPSVEAREYSFVETATEQAMGGEAPEYVAFTTYDEGLTLAVILSVGPELTTIPAGESKVLARLAYGRKAGQTGPAEFCVEFTDELGVPPVETKLGFPGGEVLGTADGLGTVGVCMRLPGFRRGDVTADGVADIGDPIALLEHLFQNLPIPCEDAADTNDDGKLDISDPISLLNYLFAGGAVPPAPGPVVCGEDPTYDTLECLSYAQCN